MDILTQCAIWKENEEYQKIIDTLENITNRTPEMDSELGCIYNIIAGDRRECYERALDLLLPHEDVFKDNHNWNYRVGYAYFNLEEEGVALNYFKAALSARPGDEDTLKFIDDCIKILSLPRFDRPFRVRVKECWNEFAKVEPKIRVAIDNGESKETFLLIGNILQIAFHDISFDAGKTKDKYILVLSPQGDKTTVFILDYFAKHLPYSLRDIWTIKVGRNATKSASISFGDTPISIDDVEYSIMKEKDSTPILALYSEKLLSLLVSEPTITYMLAESILYKVIGELSTLALIDKVIITNEKDKEYKKLSYLEDDLGEFGIIKNINLESYIGSTFTEYEQTPDSDMDANWRKDIVAGSTELVNLLDEYNQGITYTMDILNNDGIVAGFIALPIEPFCRKENKIDLIAFIQKLKTHMNEKLGYDYLSFSGEAGGLYSIYVDIIAWDLPPVIAELREFLKEENFPDCAFQVFREDSNTVSLTIE